MINTQIIQISWLKDNPTNEKYPKKTFYNIYFNINNKKKKRIVHHSRLPQSYHHVNPLTHNYQDNWPAFPSVFYRETVASSAGHIWFDL